MISFTVLAIDENKVTTISLPIGARRHVMGNGTRRRSARRLVPLDRRSASITTEEANRTRFLGWSVTRSESLFSRLSFCPLSLSLGQGLLVAEIVRYYLPDWVDMHNYTPANSLQQKKANWGILNKKVLGKFGLDIPDVIISGLSNGKPGLVEVLLFNLRLKIDEELELQDKGSQLSSARRPPLSPVTLSTSKSHPKPRLAKISSNAPMKIGSSPRRDVSRLEYEQIKQESLEQQEQIEVLQSKIRRLEHVLQLKDIRIDELTRSSDVSRPTRPTALKR